MKKKGFTLIEMLVVIAIIAVLVAITIPTVVNQSKKAAAATNAANLRSVYAQIVTERELNPSALNSLIGVQYLNAQNGKFTFGDLTITAPPAKGLKTSTLSIADGLPMQAYVSKDSVYVFYLAPGYEHLFFAEIVETGDSTICANYRKSGDSDSCANCGRPVSVHILDAAINVKQDLHKQGIHTDDYPQRDCKCDICGTECHHYVRVWVWEDLKFISKCSECGAVK